MPGPRYQYLSSSPDELESVSLPAPSSSLPRVLSFWKEIIIVLLCALVDILSYQTLTRQTITNSEFLPPPYSLTRSDPQWRPIPWTSGVYSSDNTSDQAAVDEAWAAIIPAHGTVAVNHEWAREHGLPDTISLPSDPSKGVYTIDAYHQLHCLTRPRAALVDLQNGRPPSHSAAQSQHCFDSLLQYIVCGNSGDTLLYTCMQGTSGDGQRRKCVDWRQRREWVGEKRACFADVEGAASVDEQFGKCEKVGGDGIVGIW